MADAVKLEPVAFDDRARADLAKIEGMTAAILDAYAEGVADGARAVWGIFAGPDRVGTFLWSVADEPGGRFLVIDEAYAVPVAGHSIAAVLEHGARQLAARHNCGLLRIWTMREGFLRRFRQIGKVRYLIEGKA